MSTDIEELGKKFRSLEERVRVLEKNFGNETHSQSNTALKKTLSAKEYLIGKKPKDDVQRTFYLGGYIEEYKKMTSFTGEDLKSVFREAREPVPDNINDKINKNIKKGFFMETLPKEDKKAWVLTATGERELKSDKNE